MKKRVINCKCDFCNIELKTYKMTSFICPNCGEQLYVKDNTYYQKLNSEIEKVNEEDIEAMKNDTGKIKKIISKDEFVEIKNMILKMIELLKDPGIELGVKAVIVASFVYLISPIDMIPDIIPGWGYLDDIAIIMIAAKIISDMIGDNIDIFQNKRKNKTKMSMIVYSLVEDDENLDYNYIEEKFFKLWFIKLKDLKKYGVKINGDLLPKFHENYISHPYLNKTLIPMKNYDSTVADSILDEYKEFARILGAKRIEIDILDSNEDNIELDGSVKGKIKVEIGAGGKKESKVNNSKQSYLYQEFGEFDKIHLEGVSHFMWIFTDMSFYNKLLESRINNNLLRQEHNNIYSTSELINDEIRANINKKNNLSVKMKISKYVKRSVKIYIEFYELPEAIKIDRENIIKKFNEIMEVRRAQLEQ
ncbi:MAG: DUF1232 domain-containing protein [Gudongella sp.]|nr:DUF1232 domain-containing protein [Gudongella sp.]